MSDKTPRKTTQVTASWAAASAFCGTLLALGAIDLLSVNGAIEFLAGFLVAAVTAAGVYAKERLDATRWGENGNGE